MGVNVSVLICTRDRPDTVGQAIESVASCAYERFDVHVMDQSTTDDTRGIVEALARQFDGRCRIVYHHLDKAGLSRAYNLGIEVSSGEVVACTDDDVIVSANWLSRIVAAFDADPELGLLYGQVLVPESLKTAAASGTIVPALWRDRTTRLHQRDHNFMVWGMGANMAMRRRMLDDVAGFDEALGGGAPLRSSQDFDFALRVYRAGYAISLDHTVTVDHYGSRTPEQWPATQRNYGIGDGAFYSKHIRCGDYLALRLLLRQFAWVSRTWLTSSWRERRPVAISDYGRNLVTGIRLGSRFGVDKHRRLYRETDRARIDVTDANAVTGVVRTANRERQTAPIGRGIPPARRSLSGRDQ
jgi:glycosyltransferase involved in cell wall biosynthesis